MVFMAGGLPPRFYFDSTAAKRWNMAVGRRVTPRQDIGPLIMMDEGNRNRSFPRAQADNGRDQASLRREREERRKEALDDELDRGLEDTFPGSDPVAITQPPHSARDKRRH
jgi:hypothetical protein